MHRLRIELTFGIKEKRRYTKKYAIFNIHVQKQTFIVVLYAYKKKTKKDLLFVFIISSKDFTLKAPTCTWGGGRIIYPHIFKLGFMKKLVKKTVSQKIYNMNKTR